MKHLLQVLIALGLFASACGGIIDRSPAKAFAGLVRSTDEVKVEFFSKSGKEEVRFTDPVWLEKLAAVLAGSSYSEQSHCFCISYPQIRLFRKDKEILVLSIHHNVKLRGYSQTVSGDFLVGESVGSAVVNLANEKRGADRLPVPTP